MSRSRQSSEPRAPAPKILLQPPLTARNGHTLQILEVCRVSDPTKQDERSPDEQGASLEEWLRPRIDLPFEVTRLAGSGSGECLERDEYLQLLDLIATRRFDAVLTEDLGRIVRRIHAHLACEHCVDYGTRMISPFVDQVDTAVPGWEDRSIFSAWHHERSNRDTSQRIRRAQRARFTQGGCLPVLIYGYRFRPGVTIDRSGRTDADLEKTPEAEEIYKKWFQMLDDGALYADVADWINSLNIAPGPYVRKARWDGPLVSEVTHNWLLKGVRIHNRRRSRRVNSTGRYRSERAAPEDLLIREVPHLAFFEPFYYDHVVTKVDGRNAKYRRTANGETDSRAAVAKKRTRFPGQITDCGICGRPYVFGAHGQRDHLMCAGAREYLCWNGISMDGALATERISAAVLNEIEALDGFDTTLMAQLAEEARRLDSATTELRIDLSRQLSTTDREIANLVAFIRGGDKSPAIRAELDELERKRTRIAHGQSAAEQERRDTIAIPSIDAVKNMARESFRGLATNSFEFANALRQLTGRITVYPYRFFLGAPLVLRARFQLSLVDFLPDKRLVDLLQSSLERTLYIDLFRRPQPVAFREQVVALRQGTVERPGMSERAAVLALGITQPAVQHAAAVDRQMKSAGLADPYLPLRAPPMDYPKVRRHLHNRYSFNPLPGFPVESW